MKPTIRCTLLLAACSVASIFSASCSLSAKAYPVAGPAAKKGEILDARFTWSGSGSGSVVVTKPSGEICQGRYATVVGGVVSPLATENASPALAQSISNGSMGGIQTSRAILTGDRGSVIDFEGYTSGASPTHGFGMAKDNDGSVWKLIW